MKSIKLAILCLMVVMFVSTALSSKQNTHNQHPGMFKYIKDSKVQENKLPGDVYDNLDEMVSWFIKGTGANLIVNNTFECVNATISFKLIYSNFYKNCEVVFIYPFCFFIPLE